MDENLFTLAEEEENSEDSWDKKDLELSVCGHYRVMMTGYVLRCQIIYFIKLNYE